MTATKLPKKLSSDMMQDRWASIIDPVISNPIIQGHILENISLITGVNVINHKLGRKLIGWYPTRIKAAAQLYDTQDTNQTPQLTLVIVSNANVTLSLAVF